MHQAWSVIWSRKISQISQQQSDLLYTNSIHYCIVSLLNSICICLQTNKFTTELYYIVDRLLYYIILYIYYTIHTILYLHSLSLSLLLHFCTKQKHQSTKQIDVTLHYNTFNDIYKQLVLLLFFFCCFVFCLNSLLKEDKQTHLSFSKIIIILYLKHAFWNFIHY